MKKIRNYYLRMDHKDLQILAVKQDMVVQPEAVLFDMFFCFVDIILAQNFCLFLYNICSTGTQKREAEGSVSVESKLVTVFISL